MAWGASGDGGGWGNLMTDEAADIFEWILSRDLGIEQPMERFQDRYPIFWSVFGRLDVPEAEEVDEADLSPPQDFTEDPIG
jgi:hypothetical protein